MGAAVPFPVTTTLDSCAPTTAFSVLAELTDVVLLELNEVKDDDSECELVVRLTDDDLETVLDAEAVLDIDERAGLIGDGVVVPAIPMTSPALMIVSRNHPLDWPLVWVTESA